jgi:hypothetical protein
MRRYYIITDLVHGKDYLMWAYDHSDILGAAKAFADEQGVDIFNVRMYACTTKKEWDAYGTAHFSRIKAWQCTK